MVRLHDDAAVVGPVALEGGDRLLLVCRYVLTYARLRERAQTEAAVLLVRRLDDAQACRSASTEAGAAGIRERVLEQRTDPFEPLGGDPHRSRPQLAQTLPPARENATSGSSSPHDAQPARCGRYPDSQTSLSWKERTSGSRAGWAGSAGFDVVEEVEEPGQRVERRLVGLLLDEET